MSNLELLNRAKKYCFDHQNIKDAVELDYLLKWTPTVPIFISAQTGTGKTTFIEKVIIKMAVKFGLNILILSNRIALGRQMKMRIAKIMDKLAPRKKGSLTYTEEVENRKGKVLDKLETFGNITVKSYQSIFSNELLGSYDFVIFDECHFFLSDANFNKSTNDILNHILNIYPEAIRVYMTATPSEVVIPIIKTEIEHKKTKDFNQENGFLNVLRFRPIVIKTLPNPELWFLGESRLTTLGSFENSNDYNCFGSTSKCTLDS